jgi:hypothetical protein
MNLETKFQRAANAVKQIRKIKTLDRRLTVSNCDLGSEIKRAFDLAKSSGHELNLTFSAGVS